MKLVVLLSKTIKSMLSKESKNQCYIFLFQRWEYCHIPEPGSKEEELVNVLKNPQEWV